MPGRNTPTQPFRLPPQMETTFRGGAGGGALGEAGEECAVCLKMKIYHGATE
jgi:hypothetical protein